MVLLILFLFILSQVFSPHVLAEEPEDLPPGLIPVYPKNFPLFINYFLQNPVDVISYTIKNPVKALGYYTAFIWNIYSNKVVEFAANTSYIEIGYGEIKNIRIGKAYMNVSVLDETIFKPLHLQDFMESVSFSFVIDKVPGDFNESWAIHFNPPLL